MVTGEELLFLRTQVLFLGPMSDTTFFQCSFPFVGTCTHVHTHRQIDTHTN